MFERASLACCNAGSAYSRAIFASTSSSAILTLYTSKKAFFSTAIAFCLPAISDFSVMSAISSYTTYFFSTISTFFIAKSLLKISVSS
jgi:hypothetical protein